MSVDVRVREVCCGRTSCSSNIKLEGPWNWAFRAAKGHRGCACPVSKDSGVVSTGRDLEAVGWVTGTVMVPLLPFGLGLVVEEVDGVKWPPFVSMAVDGRSMAPRIFRSRAFSASNAWMRPFEGLEKSQHPSVPQAPNGLTSQPWASVNRYKSVHAPGSSRTSGWHCHNLAKTSQSAQDLP